LCSWRIVIAAMLGLPDGHQWILATNEAIARVTVRISRLGRKLSANSRAVRRSDAGLAACRPP
jgi:hypothetical protein